MKKLVSLVLCLLMLCSMVACGGKEVTETPEPGKEQTTTTPQKEETKKDGPIEIEIWSTWTGLGGESMQRTIDAFNESQDEYHATMTFNGNYGESMAKFLSLPPEEWPAAVTLHAEFFSTLMHEGGMALSLSDLAAEENYDLSVIPDNLTSYYTTPDDDMLMMPWGNTMGGFFYNKKMCDAAGVNVDDIKCMADFQEACEKIKAATGCPMPLCIGRNNIYCTWTLTTAGLDFIDNGNGQEAFPTKSLLDQPAQKDALAEYLGVVQDMNAAGLMAPFAGSTQDCLDLFAAEEICFLLFTCGSTAALNAAIEGKDIEFGFKPLPAAAEGLEAKGAPVSGCGIFLPASGKEEQQRGGWELLKFMIQPEYACDFSINTGYLPMLTTGKDDPAYQEWVEEVFHDAWDCMEFQANSDPDCVVPPQYPAGVDGGTLVLNAIDTVMADASIDPYTVVAEMHAALQEQIDIAGMLK